MRRVASPQITPSPPNEHVDELEFEILFHHPGEGRDPCLIQLAGGAMDPGLRRGGWILLQGLSKKVGRSSVAARRLKAGIACRAIGACRLTPAGRPGTAAPLKIAACPQWFHKFNGTEFSRVA